MYVSSGVVTIFRTQNIDSGFLPLPAQNDENLANDQMIEQIVSTRADFLAALMAVLSALLTAVGTKILDMVARGKEAKMRGGADGWRQKWRQNFIELFLWLHYRSAVCSDVMNPPMQGTHRCET